MIHPRKRARAARRKAAPKTNQNSPAVIAENRPTRKVESYSRKDTAHPITATAWFTVMRAAVATGEEVEHLCVTIRADKGAA